MRALLAAALVLLAAPVAAADDACEPEATRVEPIEGAPLAASIEERECDGARSTELAVLDPNGRTSVSWYDDERGSGIALVRPPRLVAWYEEGGACTMVVYTFGPTELPCAAGAPPGPP